jgi:hypothetical protein
MTSEETEKHYQAVLDDLEQRRKRCQKELAELDQTIAVVRRVLPNQSTLFSNGTSHAARPGKYMGISVRWAILNLLAEDAVSPMPTGEIADALRRGGISSTSKSFNANVSAVLSDMTNTRKETEQAGNGYQISDHGRDVWEGIKRTEQYQNRQLSIERERPV